MTQTQMNTGPGTYGPQTTAAIAAWQSSKGINTQGNPGYFGPLSKTYLQTTAAPTPTPAPTPAAVSSPTITSEYKYGSPATGYFKTYEEATAAATKVTPTPAPTPTPSGPSQGVLNFINEHSTPATGGLQVNPSQSWLTSQGYDSVQAYWDRIAGVIGEPPAPAVVAPATPAAAAAAAPTPAPATAAFKGTAAYNALSSDLKALVDLAFSTFSGTPEQQQIFADALTQAQALADPYAKSQLTLALGEFQSQIAFTQGDLERASEIITRTREQISQDVSIGKEYLTLEQQADMSKQTRIYGEDLLTIADQAAEKGLTFATGARSRVLAEERRETQFQEVIQSGQRQYNLQMKELELKAARGDIAAQKQLADIQAKSAFQLEQIGRSAEQVLGTAALPETPGYEPVGGVLGDIEQQRRQAILQAAQLGLPQ